MDTLSPEGIVERFLEQWNVSDLRDKMPEPMVVANGGVVELTLIAVRDEHQGKGYATRALKMLTALCDENGVTIHLTARRMDAGPLSIFAPGCSSTLSVEQLADWYEGHQFIEVMPRRDRDARDMERKPRPRTA